MSNPVQDREDKDRELVDRFGRRVSYLRLSVTDRCDFRCVYCMAEEMKFLPKPQILTLEEMYAVARAFVDLGVEKIRLTGGEPLVRRGILDLVARLGEIPGLNQLVLTTNGSQLTKYAYDLKRFGVKRLNISLDSLQPKRFKELTRTGDLQQVLEGIEAAREAGFQAIKINAVVMRNRNEDEVLSLVEFAREKRLDISFIEEMPLGVISEHSRAEAFMSSADIRQQIGKEYSLAPTLESSGGPSRYYSMPDSKTRIGFISPHSHNFCHLCNRVRLTAEGRLLLCLGNEHSKDLRKVIRAHPGDDAILKQQIIDAMHIKPERHHFELDQEPQIVRFMNMTGG